MDIIQQFLKKYNLSDDKLVNYNIEIINGIVTILNGNFYLRESEELNTSTILLNYLGLYYTYKIRDLSIAKKYYLIAINKNCDIAMNNLGILYIIKGYYNHAETQFLKAIEKGNSDAMNGLGYTYNKMGNSELAEKYYLMAIEKMNYYKLCELGCLYMNRMKYDLAEKMFLMAIEKGIPDGMIYLRQLCCDTPLRLYYILTKVSNKNDLINEKIDEMKKNNKKIIYFENKKINMVITGDCPICFENTKLIPKKCAHYYCFNCYAELKVCAICRV